MRNFNIFIISFVFLSTLVSASCSYYSEVTPSFDRIVNKTVIDYAGKVDRIEIIPAYYGSWSVSANYLWREYKSAGGFATVDIPNSSYHIGGMKISIPTDAGTKSGTNLWSPYHNKYIDVIVSHPAFISGRASDTKMPTKYRILYPEETVVHVECPVGYDEILNPVGDAACEKNMNFDYIEYYCENEDRNIQGFGQELETKALLDGSKIDNFLKDVNDMTSRIYSHPVRPNCKRAYQGCIIECQTPLEYDNATGKCIISYEDMCTEKGMDYNSTSKQCEIENQCGNANASKDENSSYCVMSPNCGVVNGVCGEAPNKLCDNTSFTFSPSSDKCENNTECTTDEYVLSDGTCGGDAFCNLSDTESIKDCINTLNLSETCAPDARTGNLCYASNGIVNNGSNNVDYSRPLLKTTATGSFKEVGYGTKLGILCTNASDQCQFRLTKIYTENDGKFLCFEDAQGVASCIEISGDCSLNGKIEYENGIKQLKIEDGNKIVAYNLQDGVVSIGSIHSTCSLSGKVGHFEGEYVSSDITSIVAEGLDIKFWDEYQRGFIGVISILPTIPEEDLAEGFVYKDAEVYSLLNNGFTAFYSEDNASVYAVYNGLISKSSCESLISGTAFYIPQATTNTELDILRGLSLKSGNSYNYNDGDVQSGSCVIKSDSSRSFVSQEYSIKNTIIEDSSSIFVCSEFSCLEHSCQYNQCPTNYSPTLFEQTYFDKIVAVTFPNAATSDFCFNEMCDSNEPYFEYCGNAYGCEIRENIYQQSNGTCIVVECRSDEQLDPQTGKCVSFGCKDSTERNDKCYKTLY